MVVLVGVVASATGSVVCPNEAIDLYGVKTVPLTITSIETGNCLPKEEGGVKEHVHLSSCFSASKTIVGFSPRFKRTEDGADFVPSIDRSNVMVVGLFSVSSMLSACHVKLASFNDQL